MQSFVHRRVALLIILAVCLAACTSASEEEITQAWESSAHADSEATAFSRWNDDDPAEIPANCAKCHSTTGYLDFLGLDGSEHGTVNAPAPVGTTVECEACHNEATAVKDSASMPSGAELMGLGNTAHCMECHQGRQSTISVNDATAGMEPDKVNPDLGFLNVHNNAAGPTQYGTEALGGFEYDGLRYSGLYTHATDFETCVECHDAHTLRVTPQQCNACHIKAVDFANIKNIRVGNVDYDGDGNRSEGIALEVETIHERLMLAIKIYAARTEGVADIVYENRNPYFFDEAGEPYSTWTPRLLKAAYNYHYVALGRGSYVHNSDYTIQLLYDSLNDLGAMSIGMTRPQVQGPLSE